MHRVVFVGLVFHFFIVLEFKYLDSSLCFKLLRNCFYDTSIIDFFLVSYIMVMLSRDNVLMTLLRTISKSFQFLLVFHFFSVHH